MAENKKSFLMYSDFYSVFSELTDEEAGKLIKHLLAYVNDKNPVMEDRILNIAFQPIKMQLKRDLKSWEEIKSARSEGGTLGNLKRWSKDLYDKVIAHKITLEDAVEQSVNRKTSDTDKNYRSTSPSIAPVANVAVNDNVIVNVNDNDKVKDVLGDKSPTQKSFKNFSENDFYEDIKKNKKEYEDSMLKNFFSYWKEKSPGGKMKFQLEKTWETNLRLVTWKNNQYKFDKNGTNKHDHANNGIKSKDLGAIQLLELGKKLFSATTGGKENT